MDIIEFTKLINGSLKYEIKNCVLTLTGYYTGKQISLDLSKITAEMLEELAADDEEEIEDDDDSDLEWWQK